jgi:hypothetical protein
MSKSHFTQAIETAFGQHAAGPGKKFAGGTGYYDSLMNRYAVLFPSQSDESWFCSFDEAMDAVVGYLDTVEES